MNKEEIKEYLQKVEELELKLIGEDKDTLQWLIFGYNECARLLYEKECKEQDFIKWLESKNQFHYLNGKIEDNYILVSEVLNKVRGD